jgi:nuclear autoantigenic sperm protein
MAEKPEDQVTIDEKISKAKELFGRGARNYYVKCYVDAADDLGEACKLYGEAYGVDGDELGEVYLLYAKSLIAIGQDENKIVEVPEEEEEEEEEGGESAEGEDDDEAEKAEGSSQLIIAINQSPTHE